MRIQEKILDRKSLSDILARARGAGKKVVFTNGCFDLLHVGHTRYLNYARGLGDMLVVGLNTDDSIKSFKGDKRPLLSLDERLRIIASLEAVDYVTWFDERDPKNIILELRPTIHVKGGNYTLEQIIEYNVVKSIGAEMVLAPCIEGNSSSAIIQSVVEKFS